MIFICIVLFKSILETPSVFGFRDSYIDIFHYMFFNIKMKEQTLKCFQWVTKLVGRKHECTLTKRIKYNISCYQVLICQNHNSSIFYEEDTGFPMYCSMKVSEWSNTLNWYKIKIVWLRWMMYFFKMNSKRAKHKVMKQK